MALRLWTLVRWTGAHWIVPALFGLGVYVGLSNPPFNNEYDVAQYAGASRSIILIGPALAAAAAWQMRALTSALAQVRPARAWWRLLPAGVWPLVVGGPVAAVLGVVATTRRLPDGSQGWLILSTTFVTMAACAAFGVLIGRALAPTAAIVVAGLGTFAWLVLPATTFSTTARSLNGSFVDCCGTAYVPATEMLAGSLTAGSIVVAGTWLASSLGRWWSSRWAGIAAATSVPVLAILVAVGAVRTLPGSSELPLVQDRSSGLICQTAGNTEVCLWKEHAENSMSSVIDATDEMNQALRSIGLPPLQRITERQESPPSVVVIASDPRVELARINIVQGMLGRAVAGCNNRIPQAYDRTFTYLSLLAGRTEQSLAEEGARAADIERGRRLLSASAKKQRHTLKEGLNSLRTECGASPSRTEL